MTALRWYPRAWRERYGDELTVLMEQLDERERSSRATKLDLMRGGLAERFRILAPGPLAPRERVREGVLLVLYAWVLFVIGGIAVAKLSEHWQAVAPVQDRATPSRAFSVLYWTAGIGSAVILAGVVICAPALVSLLRRGGFNEIRRPLLRASAITILAISATIGLSIWAHTLSTADRNGGDLLYNVAFAGWALLAIFFLFAWATAGAATARRIEFSPAILRIETAFAAVAGAAMVIMLIATGIWWISLNSTAPWVLSGARPSSGAFVLEPNIIAAAILMTSGAALGLLGVTRSIHGQHERA